MTDIMNEPMPEDSAEIKIEEWLSKRLEALENKKSKLLAELNATVGAIREIEAHRAFLSTLGMPQAEVQEVEHD